jgi:hypothetical protein
MQLKYVKRSIANKWRCLKIIIFKQRQPNSDESTMDIILQVLAWTYLFTAPLTWTLLPQTIPRASRQSLSSCCSRRDD